MPTTKENFVAKYYGAAVAASQGSKILPDTIIAAAALESGMGTSQLASKYNNFFGRKPEKTWKGKSIVLPTKEFIQGKWVTINQPFKWYDSPEQGFKDYVRLLTLSKRYAKVPLQKTAADQFKEIQAAGYATDPKYSNKLTDLLDDLKKFFPATGAILLIIVLTLIFFNKS